MRPKREGQGKSSVDIININIFNFIVRLKVHYVRALLAEMKYNIYEYKYNFLLVINYL